MTELVELSPANHRNLKVAYDSVLELAKTQHMINLRVNELGQAASGLPIFITRMESRGSWVLSGIAGLELGKSLFVENGEWQASYQPTAMQTHPFYLMQSPTDEKKFTIGIDEQNNAFSEEEGEALFDENDKATVYLSQVSAILEANIKNDIQSHEFTQKLDELGLLRSIDVLVEYANGTVNTLKGLYTVDEDKLKSLPIEQFDDLRSRGYLPPVYAILLSVFQLNTLLRKNNKVDGSSKVKQIKLEVTKDYTNL